MRLKINTLPNCEDCDNDSKIFCALSHNEKKELGKDKGQNFYKKGHVIFYEGNYANGLFCIYKGRVKLSKLGIDGKPQIVRFSKDADILGYRALLTGEAYQGTATAMDDCYICHVSKENFLALMRKNSNLSWNTIQLLSQDLKEAENKIIDIAQKSVKERMAEAILMLINIFGIDEKDSSINIKLSRNEISDLIGTTTETTIRTLSQLKKDGIINLVSKKIIIKDKKKLIITSSLYD